MRGEPIQGDLLTHDLKALQYADTLDTGDLETVAALWDEASRDPRLEQVLIELDGALFDEEASRIPGIWGRVKSWPRRRRWALNVGGAVAAGVLAVLAWAARDGGKPSTSPPANHRPLVVVTQPRETDSGIAAWRQYRRALDGEDMPAFNWPVQGDVAELGIRLDSPEPAHSRAQERSH